MKNFCLFLCAIGLLGFSLPSAHGRVSVDFFHENLEAYGDWLEVGDYGYCWQPRDVSEDWSPYNEGRWLYTDAGWTWDSDEPFAWAVYHYGRWARLEQIGWVWVPGTEWGPAWVSWRRSSRHVGWAPLPPEANFDRSVGFSFRVDSDYDIGPNNYNFVRVRDFGAPRLRVAIVSHTENLTIIQQTTNITQINYVNNVVYNQGPAYESISRESAQPIRRLKLERREQFEGNTVQRDQLKSRVQGDVLQIASPLMDSTPASAPKKVSTKIEKAELNRGWKNAGPAAEVAKVRTKIKSQTQSTEPRNSKTADQPVTALPVQSTEEPGKPNKPKRNEENQVAPPAPLNPITREDPVGGEKRPKGSKPAEALPLQAAPVETVPPAGKKKDAPKRNKENEVALPSPQNSIPREEPMGEKKPKGSKPSEAKPVRPQPLPMEPLPQADKKKDAPRPSAEPPRTQAPEPIKPPSKKDSSKPKESAKQPQPDRPAEPKPEKAPKAQAPRPESPKPAKSEARPAPQAAPPQPIKESATGKSDKGKKDDKEDEKGKPKK